MGTKKNKTISDYLIVCTPEQTKKAYKIGAPLMIVSGENYTLTDPRWVTYNNAELYAPSADTIIQWLSIVKGIHIGIEYGYFRLRMWSYEIDSNVFIPNKSATYSKRKDAVLAAIDQALDFLISSKEE